jgi:hypothetical protein
MIAWLLISFGVTLVVTGSKIFKPVRERMPTAWLRALLRCPMCFGWWVGFAAGWFHFGPVSALAPGWPTWLEAFGDAFAASAWCWTVHVVLSALGADKL